MTALTLRTHGGCLRRRDRVFHWVGVWVGRWVCRWVGENRADMECDSGEME